MRTFPVRRSRSWFTGTLVFLALFWILDLAVLRAGAPDPLDDSWEYGVVARSLLQGHGFRTAVIHPPLWTLRDAALTVPVMVHGPLVPIVLAPLVAVFGPGTLDQVRWLAALFAILGALALYRLGERSHAPPTGTAAALLLTLSPLMLRAVHHDLALVLGAWLLAQAIEQLARTRPHAARAGIAMGAGLLVRPEFLFVLPILAVFAGASRRRFLLVAVPPLLPWMWHGWVNAGSPLFNLSSYLLIGYWGTHPGLTVMRDFGLPPREWPRALSHALASLPGKWLAFFPHAVKRLLSAPSGATGWLAPLGAMLAVQSPEARPLAFTCTALALVPLALMTVTLFDERYVTPFLPVFAVMAARGVAESVEWMPSWAQRPRTWMAVLVLLLAFGTVPTLFTAAQDADETRLRLQAERAALAALPPASPAQPFVYSDTPDFVAWTLKRPALWVTRAEYEALPLAAPLMEPHGLRLDRPRRTPADVTWFHAAEGRGEAESKP